MSTWTEAFEARLIPGEKLLAVVKNLEFSLGFVPNVTPTENYSAYLCGALALTNRRLIAVWQEGKGWKWFHIPALNSVSERPRRPDKPSWPHQAIVMVPGGIGLIVQTQKPDDNHAGQLSSLLVQALVTLGARQLDDGSTVAIIDYEQEKERKRRED
jgi:hypothetical protein